MNYFERYKQRVNGNRTYKEAMLYDVEYRFNQVLDEALTTHVCKYTKVNQFPDLDNMESMKININDVTNNDKTAYDEKSILVTKDANIDVGSYVYFNDCWWIIVFKEHQSLDAYKKYIMKVCNQIVKYKMNGITYDIPVNVHNMTLYSDGMADLRYVSYGDSKCKFVIGKNEITKNIDVDDRFILNHDVVYRVTNKVDYEYNGFTVTDNGIINCILLQVPRLPKDNLTENIAYNDFSKQIDELFIGKETCYVGEENEYMFNSQEEISFELNGNTDEIYITKEEVNKCILHCEYNLNLIGTTVKLIVKNNNDEVIGDKTILIKGV